MTSPLSVPSSAASDLSLRVRLADLAGERFKDLFYSILDAKRQDVARFFASNAILIWEGVPTQGKELIEKFFDSLPPTKHTLLSVDCQPSGAMLLVAIAGTVTYGIDSQTPKGFFHSFLIEQQTVPVPSTGQSRPLHYIISCTFRNRTLEKEASAAKKIMKYNS